MGLEAATYVSDLVATNPVAGDNVAEGDDHLRLLKAVLQATFPVATAPIYPWRVSAVSADQTLVTADNGKIYSVDATAAGRTITLPSAPAAGYRVGVVKSDSGSNLVTVVRAGSDTLNGATSRTLSYQYQAEYYTYIGSNIWLVVAIAHPRMMVGPSSGTDERVVRWDGTAFVFQSSPVGISDTGAITGTAAITPAASDGGALGSLSLPYSDLFLAAGGVINWASNDVTITHSTNVLSFTGASSGYSFDAAVVIGDAYHYLTLSSSNPFWAWDSNDYLAYHRNINTLQMVLGGTAVLYASSTGVTPGVNDAQALGTGALSWADLFLATGGVINWGNGNVTLTHAAGSLTLAGATTFSMGTSIALTIGTVELGHASDTTLARSAAGEVTIEGTLIKKVGKETIYIPAGAMTARTTNGAAAGTVESTTNKVMQGSLDFDATTNEYAQFAVRLPKSWNGSTVTAAFTWTANSTSTNSVVWGLQAVSIGNDETIDTAFGTAQTVTDANTATAYQSHITGETSAITIGSSPAVGDWVVFQVYRDAANGSDTLAVDAMLLGVSLHFTSSASTDA